MDGLEVIAHLRRQNLEPRLLIVIVSASVETEQNVAIDRGADGFLVKPVSDRDLFTMIEHWLTLNTVVQIMNP